MPQHLYIESHGTLVGEMSTGHLSDTCYDVFWQGSGGVKLFLPNVDTGIQRQPNDPVERQRDFQNDFIHARRAIGAAAITATRFLEALGPTEAKGNHCNEEVQIRLSTNQFDRGVISIQPQQGGRAKLNMRIGTGPTRPEEAHPFEVAEFTCEDIDAAGASLPLVAALLMLASAGPWLLRVLNESD